ncbi:MAG TPA: glycosyltransferase family 4 protein [Bryobacteraceae bacterium]|nr:glycosyltransferase family 4 protein [Bryobacteraceae bacterium]
MNLLLLDQFSEPGGAQLALLELLPAIREAGWRALVGMPGDGDLFEGVSGLGFETARIRCGPYASARKTLSDAGRFVTEMPRLARQINQLARRVQADLVYVNGPRLLPAMALAGLKVPVLFHSHSFVGQGIVRAVAGRALRKMGAAVIANCEAVASQWRSFVDDARVSVIYNGVAGPSTFTPRERGPTAHIGCIGRISPEKGQLEFVRAAGEIVRAMPACQFTVYGAALFGNAAGERYAGGVRAAAHGLPIEFAGWTNNIQAALAKLDVLLVPSVGHEATTRVILEAFAVGLPVIAFDTGGIKEVIEHGRTGYLAHSVVEMSKQTVGLLSDKEKWTAMSSAARAAWKERFTQQNYHQQVIARLERAAVRLRTAVAS